MAKYCVKGWDGVMEWNAEYYSFEAKDETEARDIANRWFLNEYLPDVFGDPQSYSSDYPDEEDFDTEEEYFERLTEIEEELTSELLWEFVEEEEII